MSPHVCRSTVEAHIPYAILRSIYSQYYSNSALLPTLALANASPRSSPAVSLTHASPAFRHPTHSEYSGYPKAAPSYSQEQSYATSEPRHRSNVRRSGPLDYSSSRKVKHVEGSGSGSLGPSPLPRFAVSRSGPISYKS